MTLARRFAAYVAGLAYEAIPAQVLHEAKRRVIDAVACAMGAAVEPPIAAARRVEMEYYTPSRDEVTVRRVDPYHLRHFEGAWYLAGFCHRRREVRTFALDRIRRLEVLAETFPRPSPQEFSPETYFGESWRLERGAGRQRVVVRFDPYQARWLRGRKRTTMSPVFWRVAKRPSSAPVRRDVPSTSGVSARIRSTLSPSATSAAARRTSISKGGGITGSMSATGW